MDCVSPVLASPQLASVGLPVPVAQTKLGRHAVPVFCAVSSYHCANAPHAAEKPVIQCASVCHALESQPSHPADVCHAVESPLSPHANASHAEGPMNHGVHVYHATEIQTNQFVSAFHVKESLVSQDVALVLSGTALGAGTGQTPARATAASASVGTKTVSAAGSA